MGSTRHIKLDDAGPTVRDVMLKEARAIGPQTPVAELRETFARPSVKLMLVADGDRFLGTIRPDDLPESDDGTVAALVRPDAPQVRPEDPVARALELLDDDDRLPVVDAEGRLQGLVCLNRRHDSFCASPSAS